MQKLIALLALAVGFAGTIAASFLLPWLHHGSATSYALYDLPSWGLYVAPGALLLVLSVTAALVKSPTTRWLTVIAGLAAAAAAVVSATLLMALAEDAITGPVVPPIAPYLGIGGPVAVAAAVVSSGALVALRPREPRRPTETATAIPA